MNKGREIRLLALVFLITLALRLCHARLLWPDEDYHLAAAIQTLHGKLLYRDFWYDKPPLSALFYAALDAPSGWLLRLFDSVYIVAVCWAVARLARDLWGEREALFAAIALAFFLNFDLPVAVIPIAPDFFMMLPHILAVHSAWRKKAFLSGLWCGTAFLFNTKAVFVLAACALLVWPALPLLVLGFLAPNLLMFGVLAIWGALRECVRQVWEWGLVYARAPLTAHPVWNAVRRILDWAGFHAALIIAAAWFWRRERNRTALLLAAWAALSLLAVVLGGRVFPRYFLQLLPVAALAAARGVSMLAEQRRRAVLVLLIAAALVPLVRFGPRYLLLALHREDNWRDVGLDQDSRAAAAWINIHKRPGDTLLVWGYRPDIVVYTRLPYGSRFGDSQPLTGVPADRHLFDSQSLIPEQAARNRHELLASSPMFIVDGLGPLNPRLSIASYSDLAEWLRQYEIVHKTTLTVIYARRPVRFSCANAGAASVHLPNLWTVKPHSN